MTKSGDPDDSPGKVQPQLGKVEAMSRVEVLPIDGDPEAASTSCKQPRPAITLAPCTTLASWWSAATPIRVDAG